MTKEALRVVSSERDELQERNQKLNAEMTLLRTRLADAAAETAQLRIASVTVPEHAAESIRTLRASLEDASEQLSEARIAMERLRMQNDELSSTAALADDRVHEAMLTALRIGGEKGKGKGKTTTTSGGGGDDDGDDDASSSSSATVAAFAESVSNLGSGLLRKNNNTTKKKGNDSKYDEHDEQNDKDEQENSLSAKEARLQALIAQQNAAMSSLLKVRDELVRKLAIANQELSVYRRVDVYSMTLKATVETNFGGK
jgi:hypothetical protein